MVNDLGRAKYHQAFFDIEISLEMGLITNRLSDITVYLNDDILLIRKDLKLSGRNFLLVSNADIVEFPDDKYVGFIEKDKCDSTSKVKDCQILPIKAGFVEIGTPILDFILEDVQSAFVGDEDGVFGFVSEEDLLKPTVRILAFTLVTHLEWLLRCAIDVHIADESILRSSMRKQNLLNYQRDKEDGLARSLVEYTNLSEKIGVFKVVASLLK